MPLAKGFLPKAFLAMKLTVFILLVACIQVSARVNAQNITYSNSNVSIEKVFREIRKQTKYEFLYNTAMLVDLPKVDVKFTNTPLNKALDRIFVNLPLTYTIMGKTIVVRKKAEKLEAKYETVMLTEVKGLVVDSANGSPLVGVTIKVRGGTMGAITDGKGEFSLNVPPNSVLEISYLGYKSKVISLEGRSSIKVLLASSATGLDQLVVVGYGVQKKETVTGAISSISGEELVKSPVANISNALAGRLPGLTAIQSSGKPGSDASSLYIRGVGTYTGKTSPLVMVDGVERENFNEIDPNNVESISVLKDASATAVYGVRGANGVILITTKRGELNQKPKVSLSAQTAISEFDNVPNFVNSYQYATLLNERSFENYWINHAKDADIKNWDDFLQKRTANWIDESDIHFTDEDLKYFQNAHKPTLSDGSKNPYYDPYFHPDKDWFNSLFKKYTTQSQVNANIRGGSERVRYFLSLGYLTQDGLLKTDFALFSDQMKYKKDRNNFRGNFDFDVTKDLTITINLATHFETISGLNLISDRGFWVKGIMWSRPYGSPGMIDGKFVLPYDNLNIQLNPMYSMVGADGRNFNVTKNSTLNSDIKITHKLDFITEGLSISAKGSYDSYFSSQTSGHYYPLLYGYRKNPNGDLLDPILTQMNEKTPPVRWGSGYNGKWRKFYVEASINYDQTFGKHHFTGLFLGNIEKRYDPTLAFDLPHAYEGLVGRFTYGYDDKYLLEYDMGYNGSENFPVGKRFGFLPAYSAGWVVSREPFFPKNNTISFLKIRGSVGKVGNDIIGDARYLYLPDTWEYAGSYKFGLLGNQRVVQGAREGIIGNPNVTWEIATKANIGVEFKMFNDHLSVTYDYFHEKRKNILSYRHTVPALVQATLPPYNLGKVENYGNEVEIKFNNHIRQFNYWVRGHIATNKNKILFMDEAIVPGLEYQAATGRPIGQYLHLEADGLYTSWGDLYDLDGKGDPILSQPVRALNKEGNPYENQNGDPVYVKDLGYAGVPLQPGNIKLIDQNEDGVIDNDDFIRIGKTEIPELTYGFSIGFNFKGFDFSTLFYGVSGVARYAMNQPHFEKLQSLWAVDYNRFSLERYNNGDRIDFPIAAYNQQASDNTFFLKNASYLRLKNAEVGYTLHPKFIGIESARFYINGNNLFTWSQNKIWGNPENLGYGGYPLIKTYNAGFNINF